MFEMGHPLGLGNWLLIILGIAMTGGGPWILYRTIQSEIEVHKQDSEAKIQWFNSGLNIVIGAALLFAGVLFIINNLRGNPLTP